MNFVLTPKNLSYLNIFAEVLKIRNYSQKTIKTYKNYVAAFLRDLSDFEIKEISEDKIRSYLSQRIENDRLSVSAVKHIVFSIKLFFQVVLKRNFYFDFAKHIRKEYKLPTAL